MYLCGVTDDFSVVVVVVVAAVVVVVVVDGDDDAVVSGCLVAGFVAAVSKVGLVIGFLVMDAFVVASVGFLVGKRVVSLLVDAVSGCLVEFGIGCDIVVNNGNTLGIKIHSGGYSVFT